MSRSDILNIFIENPNKEFKVDDIVVLVDIAKINVRRHLRNLWKDGDILRERDTSLSKNFFGYIYLLNKSKFKPIRVWKFNKEKDLNSLSLLNE